MKRIAAMTVAAAALAPPALAQGAKPCSDPVFDDFDFWVGDWDVTGADGKFAGTNSITKEEYGCLLVERWKNASGITGQSYNFVDLVTGKWRQVWVSGGATIDYAGGLNDKGAMVLEGVIGYPGGAAAGSGAKFRGTWTPNADGTVTQHFQQHDPQKDEWTDWFIGTYKRRAASE